MSGRISWNSRDKKPKAGKMRDAGIDLTYTGFDALSWLYGIRNGQWLAMLRTRGVTQSAIDDAERRLNAAISELELALTSAGVDLAQSQFVADRADLGKES